MLAGALIDNRRIYLFAVVVILAIESCATMQLQMLSYPVDISSGVSVSLRRWMAWGVM